MVMTGLDFTGKLPFKDVYLNGIVRDKSGQKMSKSKGNVIDPLDMTAKYGTDAVRFSLLMQAVPGKDIPYSEDSITGARNFCNKLYNASRFILMNMKDLTGPLTMPKKVTELADVWIWTALPPPLKRRGKELNIITWPLPLIRSTISCGTIFAIGTLNWPSNVSKRKKKNTSCLYA